MNVVFLLCDTLTRDKLSPWHHGQGRYGHIRTPNLDRLAAKGVTFDNHWINSAPCMPARRDLSSGRIEFPWRSWGPRESFDPDWALMCQQQGVHGALFTDHANLFDAGGENYHVWYDEYHFTRGHYNDACETVISHEGPQWNQRRAIYQKVRSRWRDETDTFVARNLSAAGDWLEQHADEASPFFLMIDEFDPHWPLDPPEPYRSMYLDDPSLADRDLTTFFNKGGIPDGYSEDEIAWLNAQCAGKITMVDRWVGKLLDVMDSRELWDDTVFILTSDHGEFIGEHGQMSKGKGFSYPLFARVPLIVAHPEAEAGSRCAALTSTVDLHATVLDGLGLEPSPHTHGQSVLPLALRQAEATRRDLLYGWWGKGVYWTDGKTLACKAPEQPGPLYQYGTNFGEKFTGLTSSYFDRYANAETGRFLPHTERPVYRVPSDGMCYAYGNADFDAVFNLEADPECATNLWEAAPSQRDAALQRMAAALHAIDAPAEHFDRLGLAQPGSLRSDP